MKDTYWEENFKDLVKSTLSITDFDLILSANYGWWGIDTQDDKSKEDFQNSIQLFEQGLIGIGGLRNNWVEYHNYPVIEYSEEHCSFYGEIEHCENIFDVLGEYIIDDIARVGRIKLFKECIRKDGASFYNTIGKLIHGLHLEDCIRMVNEIVLCHELGHWITHWMLDKGDGRWNSVTFVYDKQTKDLHEGLAQLFTCYAITNYHKIDRNYGLVFEFMLKGQEDCYHKHHEILSHKNFSWENVMNAIQRIRKVEDVHKINLDSFLSYLDEADKNKIQ